MDIISTNNKLIQIEGDEIVYYTTNGNENSRFNYKTKECTSWYSTNMCNIILDSINQQNPNKKYKVLVLGVALGCIIIHLLNKNKNVLVVGVDIFDDHFNIVKQFSDNTRLKLIKDDAIKYLNNTNESFDFIICDIFDNISLPSFVLEYPFLHSIDNHLNLYGQFLINTIGVDKQKLEEAFNKYLPNRNVKIMENYFLFRFLGPYNTLSVIK